MDQPSWYEIVGEVRPLTRNTSLKQSEWRNLMIRTTGELNKGLRHENEMTSHLWWFEPIYIAIANLSQNLGFSVLISNPTVEICLMITVQ